MCCVKGVLEGVLEDKFGSVMSCVSPNVLCCSLSSSRMHRQMLRTTRPVMWMPDFMGG